MDQNGWFRLAGDRPVGRSAPAPERPAAREQAAPEQAAPEQQVMERQTPKPQEVPENRAVPEPPVPQPQAPALEEQAAREGRRPFEQPPPEERPRQGTWSSGYIQPIRERYIEPEIYRNQFSRTPAPQPAPTPAPAPPEPQPAPVPAAPVPTAPDPYHDQEPGNHSQTVGPEGPVMMQDGVLHETLETFVHSKILERAVHVKGFGAFGSFQPYQSMAPYTSLGFLQDPARRTPVTCRFSLAVSNRGTPDTSRNVRGFSTKFYTDEGIFDLLCNHIPVFLVRDAIRFPEAINALSPSPVNNLMDPNRFWDFVARAPESLHFITWLYSDVGTVKSLRHLRAYGVNTYVWRNAQGERRFVKYHWIPLAGTQFIDRQEAARLAGENPDIAGQDLYDAIAAGTPVEYELRVQLMDPADEGTLPFDPLDDTKVWDEEAYPLMPVGRMRLNRNPDDYLNQVEKVAFSPANLLEGAELSADKMLQGRSFIYWDAQRRRLGPDFRSLPVNSEEEWRPGDVVTSGNGLLWQGRATRADISRQDDFQQAGQRYQSLSDLERAHLVENIALDLAAAEPGTQAIVLGYFHRASPDLAQQVMRQMGENR